MLMHNFDIKKKIIFLDQQKVIKVDILKVFCQKKRPTD